jgi:hypothetical protein
MSRKANQAPAASCFFWTENRGAGNLCIKLAFTIVSLQKREVLRPSIISLPALLRERIQELVPHGLDKLWMRLQGDDQYNIASILGYDVDDLDDLLVVAQLVNKKGYNLLKIQGALGLQMAETTFDSEKFIRFTAVIDYSGEKRQRRGGVTIAETAADPYSVPAEDNIYNYYRSTRKAHVTKDSRYNRTARREIGVLLEAIQVQEEKDEKETQSQS